MQRLKTIEFGSSTHNSPSFHPFIYANPDLEDILFSEISVSNKHGSCFVSAATTNTLKKET